MAADTVDVPEFEALHVEQEPGIAGRGAATSVEFYVGHGAV